MREILSDIVRQTVNLFQVVKITGSADQTKLQAVDDGTLFLSALLKEPQPQLAGSFGLSNISLLNGLLNFSSYKTEDATFKVQRSVRDGEETVTEFLFRDANKAGSSYKTTPPRLVPDQAEIANIPWDVEVVPTKAKIAEFTQLAGLFGEIKNFGVHVVEGNLVLSIGDISASTNNATVVLASDVDGELKGECVYSTHHFLTVLRLAGANPYVLRLTNLGVLGISMQTDHGTYSYYIRAKRA